jgi:type III pantothenate kinase
MNLVVDIGNTLVKAALFEGKEIQKSFVSELEKFDAKALLEGQKIQRGIIASVINNYKKLVNPISEKVNLMEFTHETPVPIKNLYKTSETLGRDRLAAAIGAHFLFKGEAVLAVDCGTCIKYDFVNAAGEYLGGAISPGLHMRLKALNHFTSRLPLIEADYNYEKLIGTDTKESILSGTFVATAAEADAVIEKYKQQFPQLKIVLTGGDSDFFVKRLKNTTFADPNLVLKGLNEILLFNIS